MLHRMSGLGVVGTVHFLHRAFRYRLRTERPCLSLIASLDLAGTTAIDIGAHRGLYAHWMRKAVGPAGEVIGFEPQPEMQRELERYRATFGATNLRVVPCGLSDSEGTATLTRMGTDTGGASLENPSDRGGEAQARLNVSVTTLDAYLASHPPRGRVSLLKVDVEGHERAVFRGARETLRHHRPHLLFECFDWHAKEGSLFRDLAALGFRGWCFGPTGLLPIERWEERRGTTAKPFPNYYFEPPSGS